jgi:ligand-binding sensor domain-containing protein
MPFYSYTFVLLNLFSIISCKSQESKPINDIAPLIESKTDTLPWDLISNIFQDKFGNYWIASNGHGLYKYDGKKIKLFDHKDGLNNNYVTKVQGEENGSLWLSKTDGICRFDGVRFVDHNGEMVNAPTKDINFRPSGLIFNHLDGLAYYDGSSFSHFTIHPKDYEPPKNNLYRPYSVYSYIIENDNSVWLGTQDKGVCHLKDGKAKFYDSLDLAGPAVRAMFKDSKGNFWFGNNGGGLFKLEGSKLSNITEENGLSNFEWLKLKMSINKKGTLARVFAIHEDNEGNIWVGTADSGIWRINGKVLTNFTEKDGVSNLAINSIFKNNDGNLWFVSGGKSIIRFNGSRFEAVKFKLQ